MQRSLDILLALVIMVLLSPVLLIVSVILRFSGEGEIVFSQQRVGRGGRMFALHKFATMLKDSPNIGLGTITMKNDPRVLPIGRYLRKTKINELPQIFNILKGDMSFVGPRPQAAGPFSMFPEADKPVITQVRPGLTGLGSVIFRDEESLLEDMENSREFYAEEIMLYKAKVERYYVASASLRTYIALFLITIWVVLVPSTGLVWKVFADLPRPEGLLAEKMGL